MKKNIVLTHLMILVVVGMPIIYLALIWKSIPMQIPMHYNIHLEPDRIGNKSELRILSLVMGLLSLIVYFLLRNIQSIDPKRKEQPRSAIFNKLAFGVVFFLTAMNFLVIISSARQNVHLLNKLMFPLLGLLLAFTGNYMNNLKPNYFAGIRLPWTLSDNENWRRTHHVAGKLWFWAGLLLTVISLFIPFNIMLPVFIVIVFIIIIIPVVFSYRFYKGRLS